MKGALVTGAGMRVGRALATALAADGFFLFVHYHRSVAPARETVAGGSTEKKRGCSKIARGFTRS